MSWAVPNAGERAGGDDPFVGARRAQTGARHHRQPRPHLDRRRGPDDLIADFDQRWGRFSVISSRHCGEGDRSKSVEGFFCRKVPPPCFAWSPPLEIEGGQAARPFADPASPALPSLRSARPDQAGVGVGGEGFVGPMVDRGVGDVVRIEADVDRLALQALALQPGLDHVELAQAIAIDPVDPRHGPALGVDPGVGGDNVVEAEPAGDRRRVEPIRGGREHQPPARGLVLGDPRAGAGHDVVRDLIFGEALDDALQLRRRGRADQQPVIPLLEPGAIDQANRIAQRREQRNRRQHHPPRRQPPHRMPQEGAIGRPPGHRLVHVVNGERGRHGEAMRKPRKARPVHPNALPGGGI